MTEYLASAPVIATRSVGSRAGGGWPHYVRHDLISTDGAIDMRLNTVASRRLTLRYLIYQADAGPVLPNCDGGPTKDELSALGWPDWTTEREQLYALALDPNEMRNLIADAGRAEVAGDLVCAIARTSSVLAATGTEPSGATARMGGVRFLEGGRPAPSRLSASADWSRVRRSRPSSSGTLH